MPIDQAYAKPRTMRRTAALAAIAVAALAGAWARRDYLAWLALGEGGLPANPKGWLITSYLRLRKADPIATAVYDAQIDTPGATAHLGLLPGRRGPVRGLPRGRSHTASSISSLGPRSEPP